MIDITSGLHGYKTSLLIDEELGACNPVLQVWSSVTVSDVEEDRLPIHIVTGVLVFACSIAVVFLWFDRKVRQRDDSISLEAIKTRNVVTSSIGIDCLTPA